MLTREPYPTSRYIEGVRPTSVLDPVHLSGQPIQNECTDFVIVDCPAAERLDINTDTISATAATSTAAGTDTKIWYRPLHSKLESRG